VVVSNGFDRIWQSYSIIGAFGTHISVGNKYGVPRIIELYAQNHCRGCAALLHCAGGCLGKIMAETDDLYTPTDSWCEAVRYLLERLPFNQELYRVLHP